MSFTTGNDVNFLQSTDTSIVDAGAGNDRYILSDAFLSANQVITINDAQGVNTLQLVDLTITSSKVTNNAVQLTLSNGAIANINGADAYSYVVGGSGTQALSATNGTTQTFTQFATATLGVAAVPAAGAALVNGGAVNPITSAGVGASAGLPTAPTVTLSGATTVDEGSPITYTATLSSAAPAGGLTIPYVLSGTGITPADFAVDTPLMGTIAIAANATTGTLTLNVAADNTTESEEQLTVVITTPGSLPLPGPGTLPVTGTGSYVVTSIADTSISLDTTAPTLTVAANQAIKNTASAVIQSSEVGTAYLIDSMIDPQPTTKAAADGLVTTATAAAGLHNAVSGPVTTASTLTDIAVSGLIDGEYKVYAVDAAGNLSSAATNTIKVDTTAPTASSTSPITSNSTGVYVAGNKITINFSEPVNATTLLISDLAISNSHSFGTTGALLSAILPSNNDFGTTFVITLGTSPTVTGADTITVPAAKAVDAVGNLNSAIIYTVPTIAPAAPTAVAAITALSADTGLTTDFITSTAAQTISGTYTGTIGENETLKVSLDNGTTWVGATTATGGTWELTGATITTNTIKAAVFDLAENSSTAATQAVVLDQAAPTLTSFTPADNATNIAVNANIVLTLSEAVTAVASKNIVIHKAIDDSVVETINATDPKVTISSGVVTINPSANLVASTEYYVKVDSGAFKDVADNVYTGISDATLLSFTTAAPATTTSISDTGDYTATSGVDTFNISAGNYTATINGGFDIGDKLIFPAGTNLTTPQDSGTDGIITVEATSGNRIFIITLTGVSTSLDESVMDAPTFITTFGQGSLVN